jgi:hypothetical protein
LLELLNKVCDLGLVLLVVVWVVRKNHIGGFGFGGATVLLASRGDQVSFKTTVGGGGVVLLKDINLIKSLFLATYFEKNWHSLCHFHS